MSFDERLFLAANDVVSVQMRNKLGSIGLGSVLGLVDGCLSADSCR